MILYFSGGSEIVETESDPAKAAVMMSYFCHTTKKQDPTSLDKRPNSRMRKILVIRRDARRKKSEPAVAPAVPDVPKVKRRKRKDGD